MIKQLLNRVFLKKQIKYHETISNTPVRDKHPIYFESIDELRDYRVNKIAKTNKSIKIQHGTCPSCGHINADPTYDKEFEYYVCENCEIEWLEERD